MPKQHQQDPAGLNHLCMPCWLLCLKLSRSRQATGPQPTALSICRFPVVQKRPAVVYFKLRHNPNQVFVFCSNNNYSGFQRFILHSSCAGSKANIKLQSWHAKLLLRALLHQHCALLSCGINLSLSYSFIKPHYLSSYKSVVEPPSDSPHNPHKQRRLVLILQICGAKALTAEKSSEDNAPSPDGKDSQDLLGNMPPLT